MYVRGDGQLFYLGLIKEMLCGGDAAFFSFIQPLFDQVVPDI